MVGVLSLLRKKRNTLNSITSTKTPPAQSTEGGDIMQVSWLYDDEAI